MMILCMYQIIKKALRLRIFGYYTKTSMDSGNNILKDEPGCQR
jgi:hypothetical protein